MKRTEQFGVLLKSLAIFCLPYFLLVDMTFNEEFSDRHCGYLGPECECVLISDVERSLWVTLPVFLFVPAV